jgi:SET domain-containing protein
MLLIHTQLKPSKIHGLGVFTLRAVPAGTCVWMYKEPLDYRIPSNSDLFPPWDKHVPHFGYQPRGKDYYEIPGDMAMFINHSSTPNLRIEANGDMVTVRELIMGEELTCNYYDLEEDPEVAGKLEG